MGSCAFRNSTLPDEMSSKNWNETQHFDGIFESGPLANANVVRVGYCSSDIYLGNVAASESTWGLEFRGEQIVRATFAKMIAELGFGAHEGTRLVFGGASAGARGAL